MHTTSPQQSPYGMESTAPTIQDRRRSRRRHLERPTEVAFRAMGVPGAARRIGVLLNLSPDGIAFRVRSTDASAFQRGQRLRVVFRLEGCESPFGFRGYVSNMTEGGTADHVVMGIAFAADASRSDARVRLRRALRTRRGVSR